MTPERWKEIRKALDYARFLQGQPLFEFAFRQRGRSGVWSEKDKELLEHGRILFLQDQPDYSDAGFIGHAISVLRHYNDQKSSWTAPDDQNAIAHLEERERRFFYTMTFAERLNSTPEYRAIFDRIQLTGDLTSEDMRKLETARRRFKTAYPDAVEPDLESLSAAQPIMRRVVAGLYPSPISDPAYAWLSEFETARERMENSDTEHGASSPTIH